jgi:transcription elongation GreA/GreB family factor
MSRAFVNEDALVEDVLDRPISPHPNYVTARGLALLDQALEAARHAHGAAQIKGERSELAKAASDLRYWSARRSSARVLTPDPERAAVQFGSTVTIRRDGRKQTFQIVGEDEADPPNGKISYVSPLARAVMNMVAGDATAFGAGDLELLEITA